MSKPLNKTLILLFLSGFVASLAVISIGSTGLFATDINTSGGGIADLPPTPSIDFAQ